MKIKLRHFFVCWGAISLLWITLAGGVLAISYFGAARPMVGIQVIGGSSLPTSISINGTDFQFSILSLWLLFSVAALNLTAVILIYFYNSRKNKRKLKLPMKNKLTMIITVIATLIIITIFSTVAIRWNQRYCGCTRRISCNSNLKQIGLGIILYANDNNDYFPSGDNINGLKKIIPLLNQTKVLICPKDEKRAAGKKNVLQESNSSYIYLDIECNITKVKYPAVTAIAFDKPDNNHSHVNVVYMDGHASQNKMNKNYNCEDILTTVYEGNFADPIRKLQLKKAKAMDKKFIWKSKRGRFEIIRWIFGSILLLFGGYVSSFGIIRAVINFKNKKRGIDRHVSGMPIIGPLVFIGGWYITPLPWSGFVLLILILDFDTLLLPVGLVYLLYKETMNKKKEAK